MLVQTFLLVFAAAIGLVPARADDGPAKAVIVAAASSLRFALDDLTERYRSQTGVSVKISYGSSGNLVQQIVHGAPFEIFMSADAAFAQKAIDAGRAEGPATPYAVGRIGIFIASNSPYSNNPTLANLVDALGAGDGVSLSIANPNHAPYGRAAKECLINLDLWERVKSHLIIGENATQAAQFAASGQIAGGILPLSLVRATPISANGRFFLLPASCHQPLRQAMVLTGKAGKEARALFAFLSSPAASKVLVSFGFDKPDRNE